MMHLRLLCAALVCGLSSCAGSQVQPADRVGSPVVDLCDVLRHPADFVGKSITVDVYINSMKEGSIVGSSACPKLGVVLVTTLDEGPQSGIPDLRKELTQYQRSSRPVLAFLSGVYEPDYFNEIRHRKYPVFKAYAAKSIRRSTLPERR